MAESVAVVRRRLEHIAATMLLAEGSLLQVESTCRSLRQRIESWRQELAEMRVALQAGNGHDRG